MQKQDKFTEYYHFKIETYPIFLHLNFVILQLSDKSNQVILKNTLENQINILKKL